jgi:hypothetical protein
VNTGENMSAPQLGDQVTVWPMPGLRVQDGAGRYGVFLDGPREVTWDEYWQRRYLDGAVLLHDPASAVDGSSLPPIRGKLRLVLGDVAAVKE